jgi:DNA-binding transcriptional ArsR family regulator/uncharacterized protein YndB with AHSA1/START domain
MKRRRGGRWPRAEGAWAAAIWRALADPTRRAILDLLRTRPRTTGDVASEFDVSRIAVMRHLTILTEAGLVSSRKRGRERWNYVNLIPLLRLHERWADPVGEGWARRIVRLRERSERRPLGPDGLRVDVAFDVEIHATPHDVFAAITREPDAWWGPPFVRAETTGLRLAPELGGRFVEEWPFGGAVLAVVTGISTDRFLQLTGAFHLGPAVGVAEFTLADSTGGARLEFSFQAFGAVDSELAERFSRGWRELVEVRLKAFAESGTRLGIARTT